MHDGETMLSGELVVGEMMLSGELVVGEWHGEITLIGIVGEQLDNP